ncbi:MAG: hypothetical protein GY757_42475 [bacterium]|nr:hypothetical protein [bacterium]
MSVLLVFISPIASAAKDPTGGEDAKQLVYYLLSGEKAAFFTEYKGDFYHFLVAERPTPAAKEPAKGTETAAAGAGESDAGKNTLKGKSASEATENNSGTPATGSDIILRVLKNGKAFEPKNLEEKLNKIYSEINRNKDDIKSFNQWQEKLTTCRLLGFSTINAIATGKLSQPEPKPISLPILLYMIIAAGFLVTITVIVYLGMGTRKKMNALPPPYKPSGYSLSHIGRIVAALLNKITDMGAPDIEGIQNIRSVLEKTRGLVTDLGNLKNHPHQIEMEHILQMDIRKGELEEELIDVVSQVTPGLTDQTLIPDLDHLYSCIINGIPSAIDKLVIEKRLTRQLEIIRFRTHKPQSVPDTLQVVLQMIQEMDGKVLYAIQSENGKTGGFDKFLDEKHTLLKQFNTQMFEILENSEMVMDFNQGIQEVEKRTETLDTEYHALLKGYNYFQQESVLQRIVEQGFEGIKQLLGLVHDDYDQYTRFTGTISQCTKELKQQVTCLNRELKRVDKVAEDLEIRDSEELELLNGLKFDISALTIQKEGMQKVADDLDNHNASIAKNLAETRDSSAVLKTEAGLTKQVVQSLKEENGKLKTVSGSIVRGNTSLGIATQHIRETAGQLELQSAKSRELIDKIGSNTETLVTAQTTITTVVQQLDEKNRDAGDLLAELKKYKESLDTFKNALIQQVEHLTSQVVSSNKLSADLTNYGKSLGNSLTQLEETSETLKGQSGVVNKASGKLKEKADIFLEQMSHLQNVMQELFNLNIKVKGTMTRLEANTVALDAQVSKDETVSSKLAATSTRVTGAAQRLAEFSSELAPKILRAEETVGKLESIGTQNNDLFKNTQKKTETLVDKVGQLKLLVEKIDERNKVEEEREKEKNAYLKSLDKMITTIDSKSGKLLEDAQKNSQTYLQSLDKMITTIDSKSSVLLKDAQTNSKNLVNEVNVLKALISQFDAYNIVAKTLGDKTNRDLEMINVFTTNFETLLNQLEEHSQGFDRIEKKMEAKELGNHEDNRLYRQFINEGFLLNLTEHQDTSVIKKLMGEPGISMEYRLFAINLFKELKRLESRYGEQWYWLLLAPLKESLANTMRYFHNCDGETIYESYLPEDTPGLRAVTKDEIAAVITQQHWGQIWSPLLKAFAFFSAYFEKELDDIVYVLGAVRKNILEMMQEHLGFNIDIYHPLNDVAGQLVETGEIEDTPLHYVFYNNVLPHIKNNPKFLEAEQKYNKQPDGKLVLFIDEPGLSHKGKRLRKPQLVLYSQTNMKHYKK